MSESTRPTLGSALACKDPMAELEWLEKAFGFERTMIITDESGKLVHSEVSFGNGYIMVGDEWAANTRAPSSVGGANTQRITVHLPSGLDAHCERARAAGATISMEPTNQPRGARDYLAIDPEGFEWNFSEPHEVAADAMESTGITVQRLKDEPSAPSFFPQALYKDPNAAADWLVNAFGFERTMIVESDGFYRAHLAAGNAMVAVGGELRWDGHPPRLSPLSVDGMNTQTLHIQVTTDIDAHCEKTRAAGGTIVQEPETQFYGDRTYRALDPEGHMWTIGQTLQVMSNSEMEAAAPGLKIATP